MRWLDAQSTGKRGRAVLNTESSLRHLEQVAVQRGLRLQGQPTGAIGQIGLEGQSGTRGPHPHRTAQGGVDQRRMHCTQVQGLGGQAHIEARALRAIAQDQTDLTGEPPGWPDCGQLAQLDAVIHGADAGLQGLKRQAIAIDGAAVRVLKRQHALQGRQLESGR